MAHALIAKAAVVVAASLGSPAPEHLMPLPPGPITISTDMTQCFNDRVAECVYPNTGAIFVQNRRDRDMISHALGHLFDARVLTDANRAWFTPRLGFKPGTPWKGCRGCQSPVERFADAYANCDRGYTLFGRRVTWLANYGYVPKSAKAMHDVCGAIKALAPR